MQNKKEKSKMKKTALLLALGGLFFVGGNVQATEGLYATSCSSEETCVKTNFYGKFLGGANFLQNTSIDGNKANFDTGYVIEGALGYAWHYGLRLEAEYAFRKNEIKNIDFFLGGSSKEGHCQSSSYMANLLWDLPLPCGFKFWNISPFIGAGIGYNFYQMHASNSLFLFNQKWKRFSWQLMGGLAYPIFCKADMTLEYKFHQGSSDFYNHSIGIGLIYKFGF